jgi:hypothetical protein
VPENPYNQPFPVTLAAIRKGALLNELTEQLALVVAGVVQFEKAGELRLTLKVKPAAENSEMVVVQDEIALKVPLADRPPTWFFATEDGGLARKSPTQDDLPLIRKVRQQDAEEQ